MHIGTPTTRSLIIGDVLTENISGEAIMPGNIDTTDRTPAEPSLSTTQPVLSCDVQRQSHITRVLDDAASLATESAPSGHNANPISLSNLGSAQPLPAQTSATGVATSVATGTAPALRPQANAREAQPTNNKTLRSCILRHPFLYQQARIQRHSTSRRLIGGDITPLAFFFDLKKYRNPADLW
ncbi:hypothetical protein ABE493_17330 [Stenotrophomonas terrae]|uniref:hypothetical protein n=1 Tax=Stenotrophomonas terrae TaxID=405446 RepID=UPI00320866E3